MDQVIYGDDQSLQGVLRTNADGSSIFFRAGSDLWTDYVAKNGAPPAIGTPTNKPARIPVAYTTMFNALKALPQGQQLQVLGSVCCFILVNNPQLAQQINAAFTLNLPFDQPNP